MDQNSNYITFEMNMKFQMKDYRIILGIKKTWLIFVIVGSFHLAAWILKTKF